MTVGSGNETRVISVLDDDDVGVPRSHVERGDDLRSWTQTGSLHDSGGNVDRWREYVTVRMPAEKNYLSNYLFHPEFVETIFCQGT